MDSSTPVRSINWKRNLIFIWLSQILSIAGFSSAMPFIPIYIRDRWGISGEHELGVWMSAFYFFGMFSFCLSTPIWGVLADRFGRKLMLLRACYVDAILFPCFLLAPNPTCLIVVRFISSAFTGTVSAAQTLIVTTTPQEHHGFALGTLSTAIWSGNLIGFAIGGLVVHYFGFTAAFLTCGLMYLFAGLFAHIFVQDNFEPTKGAASESVRSTWSGLSIGIWTIFALIIFTAIARRFDEPYVALMVEQIHGPLNTAFHTGWISAVAAVGGVISGMVLGRLCDKYSPEKIATPSLCLGGLTMFAQAFASSLGFYATARFMNFAVASGLEAIFLSILSRISSESRRGAIFGLASGLRMVGILFASALSGGIIYLVGVRSVYLTAGILFFLIIPAFWASRNILQSASSET
ncbi:MAG: MFS transporter [Planctomycetia bacterium]|nr:MFS transporter [Planctomycetia bacterium]